MVEQWPIQRKKTITVQQIRSAIRRPEVQTQTLKGLGLNKLQPHADAGGYAGGARHDRAASQHLVRVVE